MELMNVALIGCGVMGDSLATCLADVDTARLITVFDPDAEAAAKFGEKHGAEVESDLGGLLNRDDIRGVIIAAPPFLHRELCMSASEAGKDIFVEKPLATTVGDCDAVIAAAESAGIKLMVGLVCRYHPVHGTVKRLVSAGEIGEPIHMYVDRLTGPWGDIWGKDWRQSREKSGGVLMEINAHEIDFMRHVCGDVETVYAAGGRYVNKTVDYPDVAILTLRFKNGATGCLQSSIASAHGRYSGRIDGTEGTIDFPFLSMQNPTVQVKRFDGELETRQIEVTGNSVTKELAAWAHAVQHDHEPEITGRDGRAAVQIAVAAYDSIESGKAVRIR
jgi:predicted dehydrogenase